MSAGLGRIVDVADIAIYRKKNHKVCEANSGAIAIIDKQGNRTFIPCSCAITRFKKVRGVDIEINGGEVRWKPGTAPPQKA